MDSILQSVFGGGGKSGDDHVSQAENFIRQFEQGGNVSDQAVQRYQQVAQQVPPSVYQQAAEQAFAQLSPEQRQRFLQLAQQQTGKQAQSDNPQQLAQLATQIHEQHPGGLAAIFGGGNQQASQGGGLSSILSNPLAKLVLGGIAAMAVKQMLGNRGTSSHESLGGQSGLTV